MEYSELQVTTNFSFLRGGSHPEEMVAQAALLGYKKIAVTDRNTLAGIVRAHVAARKTNITVIPACRLDLLDGPSLLAYPTTQAAYSQLSALLSTGNIRAEKGECFLYRTDVYKHAKGMKLIAVPPDELNEALEFDELFIKALKEYKLFFKNDLHLAASRSYRANDSKKLYRLAQLSQQLDIPLAATNDVHYHHPARRELQDVLTCIREKCTIYNAGYKLYQNAERYLKPVEEMHRLFVQYPDAINNSLAIAEACTFSLDELKYIYPEELTSEGRTPQEELEYLARKGAKERYKGFVPKRVKKQIRYELKFIKKKGYASYFLTVHDFVRYARSKHILCQGRGSAANSVVCYCLGVTSVNPAKFNLLFARFMSNARNEPPDIDVDFEHERREEVMQYIYNKYGRDRASIVATVTTVHSKGAIRDVAKAMGMSADAINRLATSIWEFTDEWFEGKRVSGEGFDPNDPHLIKTLELTRQYMGFPRQLGQHTGGFVITQGKVSDLCPIMNARMEDRTCIEWNKDDIEALGFLKVDVLALGMLTCIRKGFDLLQQHYGIEHGLASIPQDDPEVYKMISAADTIGVFQIESRAQMSMLPRLRPNCFYDLVIEVAIVRPGPIQGDMVHPYLRRRDGLEKIEYPSKEVESILSRTKGVPLFQEQAMELAIVAAGFSPTEADELRRSMATFKAVGSVSNFERKLIDGMTRKGYKEEYAKRVFRQLQGFGSYGFPESHAVSFALLVYVSSWIKCHYPDVFATALLNSMPMGFYQPAQIVIDAQKHGVEVRPVDVNHSYWDNTLEEQSGEYRALRLGFRQVKGLKEEDMQLLVESRGNGYEHIHTLRDAGISHTAIEKLADADAFRSIKLDRRQALWEVAALESRMTGMYEGKPVETRTEENTKLPAMSLSEHVVEDYGSMSLSLKAHPLSFVREKLSMLHVTANSNLQTLHDGMDVKVAGLVLVRQRPGTASGICFITLEDETGIANLVVFEKLFTQFRREILQSRLLMVEGKLQREGEVIHVIVRKCYNMNGLLRGLTRTDDEHKQVQIYARADEKDVGELVPQQHVVQTEIFPGGRNFR